MENENGSISSSPRCSSIFEKSTARAFTLGGVPVLKRRMLSPSARSRSASGMAAVRPSGPDERSTSPTIVRPSRYVPDAITTALQS